MSGAKYPCLLLLLAVAYIPATFSQGGPGGFFIPPIPPIPQPPPFRLPPGFPPFDFGQPIDNPRKPRTCSNYPRLCEASWSLGPDCCSDTCVDKQSDSLNCGRCGRRCQFGQICCSGDCIDVMSSVQHCGWCNNGCPDGTTCNQGLCGYA